MKISAAIVEQMLKDSLYRSEEIPADGKPPADAVVVEGLVRNFGFHPVRLRAKRAALVELIREIHPNFLSVSEGGGGGWTFLNLPFDRDNGQWGEQINAESLLVRCVGNGLARMWPREMWDVLPGGVPYCEFSTVGFEPGGDK